MGATSMSTIKSILEQSFKVGRNTYDGFVITLEDGSTLKLGISDGRRTEVVEGLNEGDVVLIPQIGAAARQSTGSNPFGPNFRRR